MEDSVAEAGEVAYTIANTFQNLGFVVAAFGIAVSKMDVKRVKNQLTPVVQGSGAIIEFRKMGGFGSVDPVCKEFFCYFGIRRVHEKKEIIFEVIGLLHPC